MTEALKKLPAGFASRFEKGKSGNPKGRPRKSFKPEISAFDIIIDRKVGVTLDGQHSQQDLELALQFKTYQDAMAGNSRAQNEILDMIVARDKAVAASTKRHPKSTMRIDENDPLNANEALVLLGIAATGPANIFDSSTPRLIFETWAVQMALNRRRLNTMSKDDRHFVTRNTRDAERLIWPELI